MSVPLFKNALDVVVGKKLHICGQNVQIWKSVEVVVEVCGVIPNIEVVTDFAPTYKILAKGRAFFAGDRCQRMAEMTLDAADEHIVKQGAEITWEYMSWDEMGD